MFNRKIQLSFVKDAKTADANEQDREPFMTKDEVITTSKDMIRYTALAVIGVTAACVTIRTAGEVIVNTCKN